MAFYYDTLQEHAFGSYRDLLHGVTDTPAMARWRTYLHNRKTFDGQGNMPDENYAREILQLFSIGTERLHMDGTPQLGAGGQPVETYTVDDVVGLARVFTGLGRRSAGNFYHSDPDEEFRPLEIDAFYHSDREKAFLGQSIPAGTSGEDSTAQAIDIIFAHPNVAPFVSRQLIQRFTASSPESAYVERVARAFEDGVFTDADGRRFGTGERGDLTATLAAILLDETLFDGSRSDAGKLREPVLQFAQWARAFDVAQADANHEAALRYGYLIETTLRQSPFRSGSVFNFYRPGFTARGSRSAEAGMSAPEFQIMNEAQFVDLQNFWSDYVFDESHVGPDGVDGFNPDYGALIGLAEDAPALIAHLDTYLVGGDLDPTTRQRIEDVLGIIDATTAEGERLRAELAVFMAVTSSAYAVDR